ncbi:MAG: acyl-CoA dehydrogenase family protein [Dehalococcoidia bacterium]|nr:acyl-CoA dehydrogenase family protein [Dehalococcoidia bacterium]
MDFNLTDNQKQLRAEIAVFARKELPSDVCEGSPDLEAQFNGRLWEVAREIMPKAGARGWLGPSWPIKYGGTASGALEYMVCYEELCYWGIPGSDMGIGGISWIGPGLIAHGNEQQKLEHLPQLTQGKRFWCTAYSEPGSGSDMASLQTSAVRKGGDYVVNGQKVWTSSASVADWCWMLARTNPDAPKHRGLSLFLVDMRSSGITVRPLPAMEGTTPFAELFFDDVHVPASNLVGEESKGWNYVVSCLDYERASIGVLLAGTLRRLVDELVSMYQSASSRDTPARRALARNKLAELSLETEVSRLLTYKAGIPVWSGQPTGVEAAESKLFSTELSQRAAQVAMEMVGLFAQLHEPRHLTGIARRAIAIYLSSPGNTILAGTSEIERNIIAQRGLGLPR